MYRVGLATVTNKHLHYEEGGYEEYYFEIIVDEIIEFLEASGIRYFCEHHDKNDTAFSDFLKNKQSDIKIIMQSEKCNDKDKLMSINYIEGDANGKRISNIIYKNFRRIINDELLELTILKDSESVQKIRNFTAIININSQDNYQIQFWLRENVEKIGTILAMSVTEYFGMPFNHPMYGVKGIAKQTFKLLERPSLNADCVGIVPENATLKLLGQFEDWYLVKFCDDIGYAQTKFIL